MNRLADQQLTREQAIALATNPEFTSLPLIERAIYQLRQECLCMNFGDFQKGVEELLGRPVWTHEFADPDQLWNELQGLTDTPSFDEIVAKLVIH